MLFGLRYFYRVLSNKHISVAEKKDVPAIVSLVNKAYRNSDQNSGWTTEAALFEGSRVTEDSLKHLLSQSNSVFLKYRKDDRIVGCVYLQKQQPKMYLGVLAVSPEL